MFLGEGVRSRSQKLKKDKQECGVSPIEVVREFGSSLVGSPVDPGDPP